MHVATRDKVVFAREQRREPTRTEERLWDLIRDRKLGFKFRRQHPVEDFVLDFYSQEVGLCVEIDGPEHQRRAGYDEWRTEQLGRRGITVLRFSDDLARRQLSRVVVTIRQACFERLQSQHQEGASP